MAFNKLSSSNLQMFQEAYNRAPLITERGYSPTQLWIRGMLGVAQSQQQVALEFNNPEVNPINLILQMVGITMP